MTARPADHRDRMQRVALSVEGLWTGDALGQRFFYPGRDELLATRRLPPGPWPYTDDTAMALAIADVLRHHGRIDQDDLAETFARNYRREPNRGYGAAAHTILTDIFRGVPWREAAGAAFDGQGSMGNGAAMRVAPVGAYFADDYARAAREAAASAAVTHAHPEAEAGAVAVALAAAWAWRSRHRPADAGDYWALILDHVTAPETRHGIDHARQVPTDLSVEAAARLLGNGIRITAPDTVPLTLWLARRHLDCYEEAIWATAAALGDIDTNCAIVGGIVLLAHDADAIPRPWREAREGGATAVGSLH